MKIKQFYNLFKMDNTNNLLQKIDILFEEQKKNWNLLSSNYEALKNVSVKTFDYNGFIIKLQHNPKRIISSSAKTDKKSISERKCFLCEENRPAVQKGIKIGNYSVLCNPYPIFPKHLIIIHKNHTKQKIFGNFEAMLDFSEILKDYTIFYNGPESGASAPDHLHFQAGNRNFMPLDYQYFDIIKKYGFCLFDDKKTRVHIIEDGLRNMASFESTDKQELINSFDTYYKTITENFIEKNEPLMNIISLKVAGKFRVIIFPRQKKRPSQYYEKGEKNILLSPASVELGGLVVVPRKKDFDKITKEDITDIFRQVCISKG